MSVEQKGKKSYWTDELKSLGLEPKRKNDLNDEGELEALAENLKQAYYLNYKLAYNDRESDEPKFDYLI